MTTATSPGAETSLARLLAQQAASGAFVASPDFSQYGYCWLRDSSFVAYSLDRVGQHDASAAYHAWAERTLSGIARLMRRAIERHDAGKPLSATELPPARFTLTGEIAADDWPNFQIDGYGTWLWSLREHRARVGEVRVDSALAQVVAATAEYLATLALEPCFDVWEMYGSEVHTSTLACVYGGLVAAAELLDEASFTRTAEQVRDHVLRSPSPHGGFAKSNANQETEASLLWLAMPFGLVDPADPRYQATVTRIEDELVFEGGVRRFRSDSYFGGGAWPVLTASLGWHYARVGEHDKAKGCLRWIEARLGEDGCLGEQYGGERRDRSMYDEWVDRWGPPARCLTWSHAMHLVLATEVASREPAATETLDAPTGDHS